MASHSLIEGGVRGAWGGDGWGTVDNWYGRINNVSQCLFKAFLYKTPWVL